MFRFVPARCVIENFKKITKKLKKLKNTIKNSFQAKIGWKKMRKRETKIIVPFCSVPTLCVIENSIKILKNSKKKYDYGSFQAKIGRKRMRNMENKNYRFVSFLPEAQNKIPKKIKKLKNTIVDSFQAKIDWRRMRNSENKNYISVTFLSDK